MDHGPLIKIQETKAKDICARCTLAPTPAGLLKDEMTPAEFIEALVAGKHYVAGIDFMSHALPARESVWWSCLAIQHAIGDNLAGAEKEACRAAVQWVLKPTEEHRAKAGSAASAAGPGTAAGAAAMAVSIVGAPGSFTTAKAVTNAVKLASIKSNPAKIADTQRLYIDLALGIAEGRYMSGS
jgi:hypothetical protein